MGDPYLQAIQEHWPVITLAYKEHHDKKPIIECVLPRQIVYAYPAYDYIDGLTESTREDTRRLYQQASKAGKLLVFIRDSERRVLRSYVFRLEV